MESQELAKQIVEIASDKQATDILMLDLQHISLLADYFVIASAGSERQLQALRDDILKAAKRRQDRRVRVEGNAASGWVLMDFGDVVVHLLGQEERDYYQLEDLWAEARPVVRIQ